ncbi:MAG: SDR family oxidoreductase [Candidatus Competibacteraceae bacterium]
MLHDKVIIVTGASRGLGRLMAQALADRGATVVAVARRLTADREVPGAALVMAVDVRARSQVQMLVERVLDRYGRVDVLVNNAGLMVGDVAFVDTTPELWQDVLDTNLWGAFLCCRAVVPIMQRQHGGVIVNITSGAAVRTGFLNIPYGVSKAGLDRLTLGLGAELKPDNIACVSLSPPVSATETVRHLYADKGVDSWAQPPALTARALCALLADDPLQYTGQVLSVREYLARKGV